jgi:hypothetical protein
MASTIDTTTLLLTFLAADTALMAAVSNRLDGPPAGPPEGLSEPLPALRITGSGGPGHESLPITAERFQADCYGATQEGAMTVYRALNDALHRAAGRTVTIGGAKWRLIFAERESGPAHLPDTFGDLNWPRVVCAYRVTMCEWAIT